MGDPSHAPEARCALSIPGRAVVLRAGSSRERFLGYVGDISETGAFVQCSNPRSPGALLELRLHLGRDPRWALRCSGEVIWTRGYGGSTGPSPGMGIEFRRLDPASRELLRRLCHEGEGVLRRSP